MTVAEEIKAERLRRENRLDEPGFVLLAGENTDVVFSGTWRECRDNLWRLHRSKLPRYSNGIGCWVIVKDDFEAQSGQFDRDSWW